MGVERGDSMCFKLGMAPQNYQQHSHCLASQSLNISLSIGLIPRWSINKVSNQVILPKSCVTGLDSVIHSSIGLSPYTTTGRNHVPGKITKPSYILS